MMDGCVPPHPKSLSAEPIDHKGNWANGPQSVTAAEESSSGDGWLAAMPKLEER